MPWESRSPPDFFEKGPSGPFSTFSCPIGSTTGNPLTWPECPSNSPHVVPVRGVPLPTRTSTGVGVALPSVPERELGTEAEGLARLGGLRARRPPGVRGLLRRAAPVRSRRSGVTATRAAALATNGAGQARAVMGIDAADRIVARRVAVRRTVPRRAHDRMTGDVAVRRDFPAQRAPTAPRTGRLRAQATVDVTTAVETTEDRATVLATTGLATTGLVTTGLVTTGLVTTGLEATGPARALVVRSRANVRGSATTGTVRALDVMGLHRHDPRPLVAGVGPGETAAARRETASAARIDRATGARAVSGAARIVSCRGRSARRR